MNTPASEAEPTTPTRTVTDGFSGGSRGARPPTAAGPAAVAGAGTAPWAGAPADVAGGRAGAQASPSRTTTSAPPSQRIASAIGASSEPATPRQPDRSVDGEQAWAVALIVGARIKDCQSIHAAPLARPIATEQAYPRGLLPMA